MNNFRILLVTLLFLCFMTIRLQAETLNGMEKTVSAKVVDNQVILEQGNSPVLTLEKNEIVTISLEEKIKERQASISLSLIMGGILGFCLVSFQTVMKGKSGIIPGLVIASVFVILFLFATLQEDGREKEFLPTKSEIKSIKVFLGLEEAIAIQHISKVVVISEDHI